MKKTAMAMVMIFLMANLAACATRSSNVDPMYISSGKYANYNCDQLIEEHETVVSRVNAVAKKQDREATKDAVALTVGALVFWPALFFMIGSDKKEELSRLKGEYEAVQDAMTAKQCNIPQQTAEKETE